VASVGIFEGSGLCDAQGRLRLDDVRARVERGLAALPRFRQRIAEVPLGLGRPRWVDDEDFDIARHVDAVELPAPGDERALLTLVEALIMERLDRRHPLWHLRMVTGLQGGRVAMVERAHHALVDGVSGVDVSLAILDSSPTSPSGPAEPWVPAPGPAGPDLVVDALHDRWTTTLEAGRAALAAAVHPTALVAEARTLVGALLTLGRDGLAAPASSLNGPLGPTRRLAIVRERLDAVHRAGQQHDATVNDVVLTAVAGGLRELLLSRGEALPPDRRVKVLVPVSTRSSAEAMGLGNRVGGLVVPLPIGIGDPVTRLREVARITRELKDSHEAEVADALLKAMDLVPPALAHAVQRSIEHQPLVNLVVTNVHGPDGALYALGSRLLEAWPVVPLGAAMTLEVAALSYDGALTLTVTSDPSTCPDADRFAAGMRDAFRAVHAAWTPSDA
jgi:WS/DGAT/MGAT family acyltransferase